MQSQNELKEIVNTEVFENQDELKVKFAEVIEKAEGLGAVSHTIGKLPIKGSVVELLGLLYEVKFVDGKHGELRLKLVAPKQNRVLVTQAVDTADQNGQVDSGDALAESELSNDEMDDTEELSC